jgi:hypothetical protein
LIRGEPSTETHFAAARQRQLLLFMAFVIAFAAGSEQNVGGEILTRQIKGYA